MRSRTAGTTASKRRNRPKQHVRRLSSSRAKDVPRTADGTGAPVGAGTSRRAHVSNLFGRRQPIHHINLFKPICKSILLIGETSPGLWYGPRLARAGTQAQTWGLLAIVAAGFCLLALPPVSGADRPAIHRLRADDANLAAKSRSAVLGLYSLDSRLSTARDAAHVARERDSPAPDRARHDPSSAPAGPPRCTPLPTTSGIAVEIPLRPRQHEHARGSARSEIARRRDDPTGRRQPRGRGEPGRAHAGAIGPGPPPASLARAHQPGAGTRRRDP